MEFPITPADGFLAFAHAFCGGHAWRRDPVRSTPEVDFYYCRLCLIESAEPARDKEGRPQ